METLGDAATQRCRYRLKRQEKDRKERREHFQGKEQGHSKHRALIVFLSLPPCLPLSLSLSLSRSFSPSFFHSLPQFLWVHLNAFDPWCSFFPSVFLYVVVSLVILSFLLDVFPLSGTVLFNLLIICRCLHEVILL